MQTPAAHEPLESGVVFYEFLMNYLMCNSWLIIPYTS
jgi:hypothetical protein